MNKAKINEMKAKMKSVIAILNNPHLDAILLRQAIAKTNSVVWSLQILRKEVLKDEEKIKTYSTR